MKLTFLYFALVFLIQLPAGLLAQKEIYPTFLSNGIKVDGEFEPSIWENSEPATEFFQMEPNPGEPATEKSEVYIGYNDKSIFVSFKSFQSLPVIAKNQVRDALSKNDDLVAVILDTYDDSRSGYVFLTNPLGTQIDMKVNDDGRNTDNYWDTEWKCEAKIFEWGWLAEFEIPFESIKYKKGKTSWGINFGRVIRSNFETVYWSETLSDDFRISQSGKLKGIKLPGSKMNLSIFPYLSLSKITEEKIDPDFGGDIKWQLSTNVSFNATINPDFATVEADQEQINLTRYELSYPEKRLFFQEGNDMYNTRIRTFYSRRIQDIDFGERLNGKVGNTQFNILNVKTPNLAEDNPTTFFTASRAKFDFLKSSTLGATVVDRRWNDGSTSSISLDYAMNLGKTWQLTGQLVGSWPGDFSSHSAWFVRFARENNIYHYHIRYTQLGENFRENVNQTGFITDDDRREIDGDITYKWWIKNDVFEYIDLQSKNNIFWSLSEGYLRSWYLTDAVEIYMKNKLSFQYAYNNEYKLFEKEYYNYKHTFTIGYNTDEWSHAVINYSSGKNFDRDFKLLSAGAQIKLIQNLSLSYSANILDFRPDPNNNSTIINVVAANYNFSKDLWIKLFAQNNTQGKNNYFYGLLGWRFKPPFGAVYLIYSYEDFNYEVEAPKSNNFFFKLTYPLALLK